MHALEKATVPAFAAPSYEVTMTIQP